MLGVKLRGYMMSESHALRSDHSYDVVIIGSGAGGATIAQSLAATGKSVLILERGEHLPQEEDNWNPRAVFIDRKYASGERWKDRDGKTIKPAIHYWVGGNTSFYGAALFRFRKRDFEETKHYDGVSPAWPISYDDLAPYYTRAEKAWKVHGSRKNPESLDPTDDLDAPEYAYPPIEHDPEVLTLKNRLRKSGWNAFDLPLGIDRDDTQPWKGKCIRCDTCGGFPCRVLGKSDARQVIHSLSDNQNITLASGMLVTRLETSPDGKTITQVVCESSEGEHRFKGDIVVLAAGAINSAALLLKSANGAHENGLANGSDQVGRNYMFHTSSAVVSLTRHRVNAVFPKTFAINDFYWNDPEGGFDYPMGHIQLLEHMNGDVIQGQAQERIPEWLVPNFMADAIASRLLAFLVMSEDLPEQRNRVRLDKNGEIVIDYWANNLVGHERLVKKFEKKLSKLGRLRKCYRDHRFQIDELLPLYGTAHQCGTVRMGNDPKSSVVNAQCKAHEVDNLYIADSGVFVTSAAVNPALTVVANAMRVGEHIVGQL